MATEEKNKTEKKSGFENFKKGMNLKFLKIKNKIGKEGIKKESKDVEDYAKVRK